jgi:hypothetical protein
MAHRVPWSRVPDPTRERPDHCVSSHLTACSPSRRPSRPPSLTPHGPYRLDPDRAEPVCCADSALVNPSPSPRTPAAASLGSTANSSCSGYRSDPPPPSLLSVDDSGHQVSSMRLTFEITGP